MAISKERRDRFTADEGDFEIIKPAPKKNTQQKEKTVKKPAGKSNGPKKK